MLVRLALAPTAEVAGLKVAGEAAGLVVEKGREDTKLLIITYSSLTYR